MLASFPPSPKLPGTGRTVAFEDTLARVRPLLPRVPVTRVSDVTPLDEIGLPVFSAVTPLARDLTVHMGKGATPLAARLSAIMEAFERVSAEVAPVGARAAYRDLADAVPPDELELPADSAYRPDAPLDWTLGHDLLADRPAWMAVDLVASPPTEGVLRSVDTNGLASGNTPLEAIVHALCEVIERDALSQIEFAALFADANDARADLRAIDLDSLDGAAGDWVERARGRGLEVVIHEIATDLRVPTFLALLVDRAYGGGGPASFFGLGTDLDARVAVLRGITEAIQGRLSVIQGARDSYNRLARAPRAAGTWERLRRLGPARVVPFAAVPSLETTDLRDDLRLLLERLAGAGFRRCVVNDLTSPRLRVPVVRVRVPGASQFAVNMRRLGWRCLRHLL